jgi:hypothetical protein
MKDEADDDERETSDIFAIRNKSADESFGGDPRKPGDELSMSEVDVSGEVQDPHSAVDRDGGMHSVECIDLGSDNELGMLSSITRSLFDSGSSPTDWLFPIVASMPLVADAHMIAGCVCRRW